MSKSINLIIFVVCGLLYSTTIPEDGSIFNYTQIFFSWDQIPNTSNYDLFVQNINNDNILEKNCQTNSILITDSFEWNSNYIWYICGYNDNGENTYCTEEYNFNINPLPDYFPDEINIYSYDSTLCQEGITLMDFESLHFSGGLNEDGEPIWFANRDAFTQKFIFTRNIKVFC